TEQGRRGERAAARHLTRRGWTILASRWRGAGGELDLVAARGAVVAICEVKARCARAAEAYLAARPELAGRTVRLDLIAVRLAGGRARVVHRPGAIGAP
ncbi:MAG TPA: YraN family protein, partial [Miltoncostaeaceae bacterium]|nr:YraN family protein [Miltoncostaeaceae bacterium]